MIKRFLSVPRACTLTNEKTSWCQLPKKFQCTRVCQVLTQSSGRSVYIFPLARVPRWPQLHFLHTFTFRTISMFVIFSTSKEFHRKCVGMLMILYIYIYIYIYIFVRNVICLTH
jgi:hypothetical protein